MSIATATQDQDHDVRDSQLLRRIRTHLIVRQATSGKDVSGMPVDSIDRFVCTRCNLAGLRLMRETCPAEAR